MLVWWTVTKERGGEGGQGVGLPLKVANAAQCKREKAAKGEATNESYSAKGQTRAGEPQHTRAEVEREQSGREQKRRRRSASVRLSCYVRCVVIRRRKARVLSGIQQGGKNERGEVDGACLHQPITGRIDLHLGLVPRNKLSRLQI